MTNLKYCFVSNYLTHHQLPFCLEMVNSTKGNFYFIETEKLPTERVKMGYESLGEKYDFVINTLKNKQCEEKAKQLVLDADVLIFGSAPIKYLTWRMKENKLTFIYSERIFKKRSQDLFRWLKYFSRSFPYRSKPLYYLFSSAYAAGDYKKCLANEDKMFKWGYFPENIVYDDIDLLIENKNKNSILFVGRLIEWKHPEAVISVAKRLRDEGYDFELSVIGNGSMEQKLKEEILKYDLSSNVKMLGAMSPDNVRSYMEKSEMFLFTSDRNEGWGAVLNESMNSACAVIANKNIGAVPFLMDNLNCGLTYDGDADELYRKVKWLLDNPADRQKMAKQAYMKITSEWNAKNAAQRLIVLSKKLYEGQEPHCFTDGPCSKAVALQEK